MGPLDAVITTWSYSYAVCTCTYTYYIAAMIHLEQDPSKYYYMGEGKMTPQDKNDFEATIVSTVESL